MLKKIRVADSVGKVLLHDLTGAVNGKKQIIFKRGHIILESDIETLVLNGKTHINILVEDENNLIHEEEAAKLFAKNFTGENVTANYVGEGKVSFISNVDGFVNIDSENVFAINCFEKVSFATKKTGEYIKQGEIIAAFRIVELFYDKLMFNELLKVTKNFINVSYNKVESVALITVGSEIYNKLKPDLSLSKLNQKLAKFNLSVTAHSICDDDALMLEEIVRSYHLKYDLILCIGGMSVDADDITANIIEKFCDQSIYGTPIMPGSVFMIARKSNKYVLGLPANVLFSNYTAFDLLLPYVLMQKNISKVMLARFGYGGLL